MNCIACGAPTFDRAQFVISGEVIETSACSCLDAKIATYRRLQSDAADLKRAGVHRRMVSRIMNARLDRGEYR